MRGKDVELQRVSMRFGGFVAVHETDLIIRAGEFFSIPRAVRLRQDHHPAHDLGLPRADRRRDRDRR